MTIRDRLLDWLYLRLVFLLAGRPGGPDQSRLPRDDGR